jgi:hypothetical protein
MFGQLGFVMASFTLPMNIETAPGGLLWLLPLALSIAGAYKAMKMPEIKLWNFVKEVAGLFTSIVVFMVLIGVGVCVFDWLFLQRGIFGF